MVLTMCSLFFFFFNDTATTEIYTLSLHDALPISIDRGALDDTVLEDGVKLDNQIQIGHNVRVGAHTAMAGRSEEHTSELQSLAYLVCRLLLEKKKKAVLTFSARERRGVDACDHNR